MERDGALQANPESLLDPKGDPMSLVKWTTKSLAQLVKALGHQVLSELRTLKSVQGNGIAYLITLSSLNYDVARINACKAVRL